MGTTSRRGFLKGLGATLGAVGITTAVPALVGSQQVIAMDHHTMPMPTPTVSPFARREIISPEILQMLVAETLTSFIGQRRSFTAYDITQALRTAHGDAYILHADVRTAVHQRMAPHLTSRVYGWQKVRFPSGLACLYRPLT